MSFLYFFYGFLCQWVLALITTAFSTSGLVGSWIDSIPMLIAYVLFYIGFQKLEPIQPLFVKGKISALILFVLSLIPMFIPAGTTALSQPWWGTLLTLIVIIPETYLIYYLCIGIGEIADKQSQSNLQETAKKRWRLFIYCQVTIVLALLSGLLANTTDPNTWTFVSGIFSVMYVILNLVVYILMLTLVWRAHKQLELPTEQKHHH